MGEGVQVYFLKNQNSTGNHQVMQFSKRLQALGMNVVGIRSPTVPRGKERIRICLHVGNSEDEIDELCCSISRLYSDMNIGGVGATMARL